MKKRLALIKILPASVYLVLIICVLLGFKKFHVSEQVIGYWNCDYGFSLDLHHPSCQGIEQEAPSIAKWLQLPRAMLHYPVKVISGLLGLGIDRVWSIWVLLLIGVISCLTACYITGPNRLTGEVFSLSLALYSLVAFVMNGRLLYVYLGLILFLLISTHINSKKSATWTGVLAVLLCSNSSGGLVVACVTIALIMVEKKTLLLPLLAASIIAALLVSLAVAKLWLFYSNNDNGFAFDLLQHGPLGGTGGVVVYGFSLILLCLCAFLVWMFVSRPGRPFVKTLNSIPLHLKVLFATGLLSVMGGGIAAMSIPSLISECCIQYGKYLSHSQSHS